MYLGSLPCELVFGVKLGLGVISTKWYRSVPFGLLVYAPVGPW